MFHEVAMETVFSSRFFSSASTTRVAVSSLISVLGSFSLYYSTLILGISKNYRILVDSTTLAHVAADFMTAMVVSAFLANILPATIWIVFIGEFSRKRPGWKSRSRQTQKSILWFMRRLKKYDFYIRSSIFVFVTTTILVGHLIASFFLIFFAASAWITHVLPARIVRNVWIVRVGDVRSIEKRIKLLAVALFIAMSSFALGISKIISLHSNLVIVSTLQGKEVRPILYKTSNGLLFGQQTSESYSTLESFEPKKFIPFDQIVSIETVNE